MSHIDWSAPLIPALLAGGIEPDQRMRDAIQMAHHPYTMLIGTGTLFAALQILNTRGFEDFPDIASTYTVLPEVINDLDSMVPSQALKDLVEANISELRTGKSFGASQYLKFVIEHAIGNPVDSERPKALMLIAEYYTGRRDANLDEIPEFQRLLGRLRNLRDGANDYQYILVYDSHGHRYQFRVVSDLKCGAMENDKGILVPQKALLTHIGDLGFFTFDSIAELEELINTPSAGETEFQKFFERHPHFLRREDYREVHPHVYLHREEEGPLIPDFILTNPDIQKATLVELKRARLRVRPVRRESNRVRFGDLVMGARAQLLKYRDWFDQPNNRLLVANKLGMQVYKPKLMVIIGRASDFSEGIERASLAHSVPDLEVVTYDDLLHHASNRRAMLQRNNPQRLL